MIVKVNNNGIAIDVSASAELTKQFGTTHGTMPVSDIAKVRIHDHDGVSMVEIVDLERREYCVLHSLITSYNGVLTSVTPITDAIHLKNKIDADLFGL